MASNDSGTCFLRLSGRGSIALDTLALSEYVEFLRFLN